MTVLQIQAQQVADTLFNPAVLRPVYEAAHGPVILIDEAHGNFHTAAGRFGPFADLLRRDGYQVKGFAQTFTKESLAPVEILVIANALHSDNFGKWTLPTPSAFTDEEIFEVNKWVSNGGSLFLIADHMPFPGAAEKLAASFGVKFYNGFAMRKRNGGKDIFSIGNGLHENALTQGRNPEERITSLQTFTGQAFEIPEGAHPVVTLNDNYNVQMPVTAWQFEKDTPTIPATNLVQGAFFKYSRGRVVVFGEAAMFTAQTQGKNKFGMNGPDADQNPQFLMNTIHWLDGLID